MNLVVIALIEDISKHKDGPCVQLTPEQEMIAIPWHLVYLAGLLFVVPSSSSLSSSGEKQDSSTSPPYPKVLRDRFQEYQTLFHNKNQRGDNDTSDDDKEGLTYYSLSPRMVPTKDQQRSINQDFQKKSEEMESMAIAVGEGLAQQTLTTAKKESSVTSKPQPKPSKKKTMKKKTLSLQVKSSAPLLPQIEKENQPSSSESETLEQIQLQIQHQNAALLLPVDDDDDDDSTWITVSKKNSKDAATGSNEEEEPSVATLSKKFAARLPHATTISSSKKQSTEKEEFHDAISSTSAAETSKVREQNYVPDVDKKESSPKTPSSSLTKSSADDGDIGPSGQNHSKNDSIKDQSIFNEIDDNKNKDKDELVRLQIRIRQLEQQLVEKDEALERERQNHTKAFRDEKEKTDNLIQSMQLRLYISETRLKTYQDALDQHLEAVAANTASNSYSSPMRNKTNSNNTENHQKQDAPPPSSPLISRVLQQRNRLQESGKQSVGKEKM